MSVLFYTINFI